jgi:hypothetical protein
MTLGFSSFFQSAYHKILSMHDNSIARLSEARQILFLIYHRNKNQHQTSKWWKWLSILQRNLVHLLTEQQENKDTRVKVREQHISSNIVPKCYL